MRITKSINSHRLPTNPKELLALKLLYQSSQSQPSIRETLLQHVLHRDGKSPTQHITQQQLEFSQQLQNNYTLAEQIIDTTFQWFGSPVGLKLIKQLINTLEKEQQ